MSEAYDPHKAKMRMDRRKLLEQYDPAALARETSGEKEKNKPFNPTSVEYTQSHVSRPEPEQ